MTRSAGGSPTHGLLAGFSIGGMGATQTFPLLGGALVGLPYSATHYTGMRAYHVVGLIEWRLDFAASVSIATLCLAAAAAWSVHLVRDCSKPRRQTWGPVGRKSDRLPVPDAGL